MRLPDDSPLLSDAHETFIETEPEKQLPELPSFFHLPQPNDKFCPTRARAIPAIILVKNESGLAVFGNHDDTGSFLVKFCTYSQFPSFAIEVRARQNCPGDKATRGAAAKAAMKATGKKVQTAIYKTGRDEYVFDEDYVEDHLEFDVDIARSYEFCPAGALSEDLHTYVQQVQVSADVDKTTYGVLKISSDGREGPNRYSRYKTSFEDNSKQNLFFAMTHKKASDITIICCLGHQDRSKAKERSQLWRSCDQLFNTVRTLHPGGFPINDFYLARHPCYDTHNPSPFQAFISNAATEPPKFEWLQADGQVQYIYQQESDVAKKHVPRPGFGSLKQYKTHMQLALVIDQNFDYKEKAEVFSLDRHHEMVIDQTDLTDEFARHLFIGNVRLRVEDLNINRIVPLEGSDVQVRFPDIRIKDAPGTEYPGKVLPLEKTRIPFDFSIILKVSAAARDALLENEKYRATITMKYENPDIRCKLFGIAQLTLDLMTRATKTADLPTVNGHKRGKFQLRSLILEPDLEVYSDRIAQYPFDFADSDDRTGKANYYLLDSGLNGEQQTFLRLCLNGAPANTVILQGLPGSGKTRTLGYLITVLGTLNEKVLGTGQSNDAVNTLHRSVISLIDTHAIDYIQPYAVMLREQVVRIFNPRREEKYRRLLSNTGVDNKKRSVPQDCMSQRMYEYIEKNPEDPDVIAYVEANNNDRSGCRPTGKSGPLARERKLPDIVRALQKKILAKAKLVFCTMWVAADLHEKEFPADVCIMDEAAQATEPDTILCLSNQRNLKLAVFAGDEMQLDPFVKSNQARCNILGDVLATSMMSRITAGCPKIEVVTLRQNYRSHPKLIEMPTSLYYQGSMTAAEGKDWADAPLNDVVTKLIKTNIMQNRIHAYEPNPRQLFFDVQTLPEKEECGTSITNPGGVQAIVRFTSMLISTGVDQQDIGIISMYKYDADCLKLALDEIPNVNVEVEVLLNPEDSEEIAQSDARFLDDIDGEEDRQSRPCLETSTVDAFQGREKKIIIIHFVAAYNTHNPFGHVSEPRRLCVATTRAQEYQFMFGNITFWKKRRDEELKRKEELRKNRYKRRGDGSNGGNYYKLDKQRIRTMYDLVDWVTNKRQVVPWAHVLQK